jgi:transcriptional regulator with XRE-family HTH domain
MPGLAPEILKRFRAAHEESDWSLTELGRELGWSKSRVWNYLSGFRKPSVGGFARMVRVLELDPAEMIDLAAAIDDDRKGDYRGGGPIKKAQKAKTKKR